MNNTYGEILKDCVGKIVAVAKALNEAMKGCFEWFSENWETIKTFVEEKPYFEKSRPTYFVPRKLVFKPQVLIRKPKIVFARSNC